jgi:hypothetical protein
MFSIHLSHRISRRTELTVDLDIKADLVSGTWEGVLIPASKEGISTTKDSSELVREFA